LNTSLGKTAIIISLSIYHLDCVYKKSCNNLIFDHQHNTNIDPVIEEDSDFATTGTVIIDLKESVVLTCSNLALNTFFKGPISI